MYIVTRLQIFKWHFKCKSGYNNKFSHIFDIRKWVSYTKF